MTDRVTTHLSSSDNARLLKRATTLSTGTAFTLIGVKLIAALVTGSVSVLASLVDSLMDAAASVLNLLAVRYSLKPADEEHRFGHGKAESLAGLSQSAFICGSAVFLILHAIDRLIHPQPLQAISVGIGVMVFSIVATGILIIYQQHVIRKTGSVAIAADALHYKTDILTHATIILALSLNHLGIPALDAIMAILIGIYILWSAWKIGFQAIQLLLDRELPDSIQDHIRKITLEHAEVRGLHEMRTRQSGQVKFIQLHLELDPDISLKQAHHIAEDVEFKIRADFPEADILIHQDIAGVEENHRPIPVAGS